MSFRVFEVARPRDTLFLPPPMVSKWRGLRGLVEQEVALRSREAPVHLAAVGSGEVHVRGVRAREVPEGARRRRELLAILEPGPVTQLHALEAGK